MQLKGMIFDLDGTLAETWPICFVAFRNAFIKHANKHYTDEEIEAMFGPDEEGIIKGVIPINWQAAVDTYLDEYERAHFLCNEPFPGMEQALTMLKDRGVKLAVVTGKAMGSAIISLKRLKLEHYFDSVEPGHWSGGVKPAAMQKVIDRWGFAPEEVAYIGDSPSDVDGSHKVGVIALGASWCKLSKYDEITKRNPAANFRTVDEFNEWIKENTTENPLPSV